MNSQPTRECCFRGRCSPQNYRCQLRKSPHLALQPIPVSQPQGGLCLRDANSSRVPALLHTPILHPPSCSAAPSSHHPPPFRLALVTTCFSFGSGTRQSTPSTGRVLPSAPALLPQREGARQVLFVGPFIWLCCSLVLWEPNSGSLLPVAMGKALYPHGHPSSDPGHGALGEGAQQRGPPQRFGWDGLPVLFPPQPTPGKPCLGVGTCCGVAEAGFVLCPHPHLFLAKGSGLP